MARADIPNGVLTIIASFSNGLEILRKFRKSEKKRPRRSKASRQTEDDALRLSRSLRHGPEEIGREYQAGSMRCDSERFAAGDAIAQNSLAEILLKLNTGLVGIISSFTNHGKTGFDLDYHSLTDLSEQSRIQTVGVLRQLCQRLMTVCVPANMHQPRSDKVKSRKPNQRSPTKRNKKRYLTLARVLIENSSVPSQIALIRPSDTRKQRPTTAHSLLPKATSKTDLKRRTPASSSVQLANLPPPYYSSTPPAEEIPLPKKSTRHQQSFSSLPRPYNTTKSGFPMPSSGATSPTDAKIPKLNSTPVPPHDHRILIDPESQYRRPDTFYSVTSARTGSTKLGEIPMHKWAEPWDYKAAEKANEEAIAKGWPVSSNTGTAKQKKGVWKRWFGKKSEST